MEEIEYISMEPDFKAGLEAKYRKPLRNNTLVLTIVFLFLYLIIMAGSNAAAKDGYISFSSRGDHSQVSVVAFNIGSAILFLLIYVATFAKYAQMNIHYLKDAQSGYILKERMRITKVFMTPVGINIYWLDSSEIKSFTPDPYRNFREGDAVIIYYLKYSREYLAYELG